MTKVQSKDAFLFDLTNDTGTLRDGLIDAIGEGTAVEPGLISALDKAKLDGIVAGATANATDAALRDRTTHTGEQAIGTITGLVDALAGKATPADVAAALAGLVGSSPATLDTLNELAAALGDDPAFATTVSTALGNRLRVDAAQGLTAPQQAQGRDNLGLGSAALAAAGDFATAAQGAKADVAASITMRDVSSVSDLSEVNETEWFLTVDRDPDSEGSWVFDGNDRSADVTLDPEKIGYVAPSTDPTGSTGAWRRNLKLGRIYPEVGGCYGDDTDRAGAYLKMQAAINFAAREGVVLSLKGGGLYRIDGFLSSRSKLWIERGPGAVLRQTEWSQYAGGSGAFFSNVYGSTASPDHMVQSGIRFDLEIDGSLIPARTIGFVVSATSDTVTLPAEFDGKIRAGMSRLTLYSPSGGATQVRLVSTWDAGTRTATLSTAWDTTPDNTYAIGEGSNDNAAGFARGASDIVGRIVANDYPSSGLMGGSGGKACGLEKGVRNADITVVARRCGWAGWVQGVAGTFSGYSAENQALGNDRQWARDIRFRVDATDCESAFGVYGIVNDTDPVGYGIDSFVKADVFARNCGHSTNRLVSSNRTVKCGVITLAEAENFTIDLDSVTDDDFNPTWPDGTGINAWLVGSGLSSGIGAVVVGWGRNGTIRARHTDSGATYKCDSLWTVDNVRAMYEDSSPTAIPQNVFDLDIDIKHVGAQPADGLINQPGTGGNIATSEFTAAVKFTTNYIPTKIVGDNMSYIAVDLDVQARIAGGTSKRVHGKASRIKAEANDLTSFTGFRDLRDFGVGAGRQIVSILTGLRTYDVGTVGAGAEVSFTIPVTGVATGQYVFCDAKADGARIAGISVEALVTAADEVTVYVNNTTGSGITPGSRGWTVMVTRFA